MADHEARMRALHLEFIPTVEKIAQDSAETEAVLHAKDKSGAWKASARLEYELQREVDCWEGIRRKIDERVADRIELVEQQRRKRALESDG